MPKRRWPAILSKPMPPPPVRPMVAALLSPSGPKPSANFEREEREWGREYVRRFVALSKHYGVADKDGQLDWRSLVFEMLERIQVNPGHSLRRRSSFGTRRVGRHRARGRWCPRGRGWRARQPCARWL